MAYWKKLKNTDAVPVLKDELVFDTTPTVNSTNPVTSDGIARAIAGASGEVPVVTESDNGKILTAVYDEGGAAVEWADVPSEVPEYSATEEGKVLGVVVDGVEDTPALGWVDQPADELPSISGNAGKVLKVNSGATGVEWGEAGANYSAGNGIAISEQGAISAVGGEGITVTAGSTVQKTLTAHTQDYEAPWQAGLMVHYVTYVSLLDSGIITDIQNGGIDVTLAYPFFQFAESSDFLYDWSDHQSSFKAYAAIVELQTITISTVPTYWGSTADRLVLGEITSQWADTSATYPTILANTVVNYDFADVNASLSTITLADVLANPGNYCLTVLLCDTYGNLNAFDDGSSHTTCNIVESYVTGEGTYTTGSYMGMSPSAITVTNPVPAYAAGDAGKVLQVNSAGTGVEWAAPSGGYTPVDLQTITAAPYNIPVSNRQDVAVTLTGYSESDFLTIQVSSDCTDAVVKVNATPAGFRGIRVLRGSDTVTMFGSNDICNLTTNMFADAGRVVLSTNDPGGSGAEAPTSFAEMEVLPQADIIGSVDYEVTASSHQTSFLVEIKGRNAILHV